MTITQLQYVIAVAEQRNFTLAAQACFVTQPTLSMQVQKLEEELEVKIFDRTRKPIGVTEIGSKIVDQARLVVAEAYRIADIVDQDHGFVGGDFKLGIIPTVMPTLLPLFLKDFIRKYPEVKLSIRELPTRELIGLLEESQLDAAVVATPLGLDQIRERPLYYEPFVGYIPEGNALALKEELHPEDLQDTPVLVLKDGHCFRENVLHICKTQSHTAREDSFSLESGSFETLMKLADDGLGITVLPYLQGQNLPREKKKHLRPFRSPQPAREISLIYHRNELKMQIVRALHETIGQAVKREIAFQDVDIISPK